MRSSTWGFSLAEVEGHDTDGLPPSDGYFEFAAEREAASSELST
jgi:hypothetical protein